MTTLNRREAPGLLDGAAGASEDEEGYEQHAPHAPRIPRITPDGNLQRYAPIVQAMRILARHGRRQREAKEAAAAAHSSTAQPTADVDELADRAAPATGTISADARWPLSQGGYVSATGRALASSLNPSRDMRTDEKL